MSSTASLVNNMDEDEAAESSTSSRLNDESIIQPQSTKNTYVLEVSVMMLFFAWNLSGTVFQNQILYQSCTMNFNTSTCANVIDNKVCRLIYNIQSIAAFVFTEWVRFVFGFSWWKMMWRESHLKYSWAVEF